jgi:hypothetical protein
VFSYNYREDNDIALAQQLQDEMKIQSNSIDQTTYNTHHQSSDDQVQINIMFISIFLFFFHRL